ncbi:MAG: flagellar basal body rod protein FlgC [Spirochaetia bacterium]
MFSSINIASSALSVERLRMDVIGNNIANAETTRTPEGGPFQRSRVIVRPMVDQPYWKSPFLPESLYNGTGKGVRVVKLEKDQSMPVLKYDPTHPDRIMEGPRKDYVEMPNVKIVDEMVDLISASRAYEANVTLIESAKNSFMKALEIAR